MNEIETTLQESANRDPPMTTAVVSSVPLIPGYEVLGELGRGGMGVVFKARQIGLDRIVALKMILSGELAGESERKRFQAEARAAAALQHPNIVQVHEVGEREGNPYFSLEFIDGGSLAERLDGTPFPARDAAALMETLARAVHHAHLHGIVHRDLKPTNVLMTSEKEAPSQAVTPKITDFGLAKRLDDSSQTRPDAILGTPSYMAPEQAAGKGSLVGPLADIYSLGSILYELLTGRPPFKGETAWDTITQVIAQEPVPPTRLQSRAPRDLETITLKCLQKEPLKRYDSALALAEDLRRFLDGVPIAARPASRFERAIKWARRRPAVAGLIAVSLLAFVALLVGGVVYNLRLQTALEEKEIARWGAQENAELARLRGDQALSALEESQENLQRTLVARANLEWEAGNVGRALAMLDECDPKRRRLEWHLLRGLCRTSRDVIRVTNSEVTCLALSLRWSIPRHGDRQSSAAGEARCRADLGSCHLEGAKGIQGAYRSGSGRSLQSGWRVDRLRFARRRSLQGVPRGQR